MRRPLLVALVAAIPVACAAQPFRGDTGIRPFSFDLWDVHCPSGLRVIVERAPGAQAAGVTVLVGVGARDDPPGREGLAHLVEHLTFRSHAPDRAPVQLQLGLLGASRNAVTNLESTTYHAFVPRPRLDALMAVEVGRLAKPLDGLDDATFAIERDVVRNELRERSETNHLGAGFVAVQAALFPATHPYSRPIGGTHQSVSALSLADARAFVAAYYRPEMMTMVVVGDLDLSQAEAWVKASLPPALYGDPVHPRPVGAPTHAGSGTSPPLPQRAVAPLRRVATSVDAPELWLAWALPGGYQKDRFVGSMWSTPASSNFERGRFDDADVAGVTFIEHRGLLANMLTRHLADHGGFAVGVRDQLSHVAGVGPGGIHRARRRR